jgi:hypothetical protein
MRMNLALISCLLLAGCGDDTTTASAADLAVSVDMTLGPDMATRKPNGVACGSATCTVGQECCVITENGQVTDATCIAAGGACAGSVVACDGPEDCNSESGGAYCCATVTLLLPDPDAGVQGGVSGGTASCTNSCAAAVDVSGPTLTSRLCSSANDCTGLVLGPIAFNQCCSTPLAPNTKFCGNALLSQGGIGVVCN